MIPYFSVPPLQVGGFELHPFGACLLLGWIGCGAVGAGLGVRWGSPIPALVAFVALPLGLPFGHLVWLLGHDPAGLTSPAAVLSWKDGNLGAATLGASAIVAVLAAVTLVRDRLWGSLDALAYGLLTTWWSYRLGCTFAHDYPGLETTFPLGVRGICPGHHQLGFDAAACHDLGLYEWLGACGCVVLAGLVVRHRPHGLVLAVPLLGYPTIRVALSFVARAGGPEPASATLVEAAVLGLGVIFALGLIALRARPASGSPTPH